MAADPRLRGQRAGAVAARAASDSSRRWAYASLAGAVAFAAAAGAFGWLSVDAAGAPALRF